MVAQKLDYIHYNLVKVKWSLVEDSALYLHSSTGYISWVKKNGYVVHHKESGEITIKFQEAQRPLTSDAEREVMLF